MFKKLIVAVSLIAAGVIAEAQPAPRGEGHSEARITVSGKALATDVGVHFEERRENLALSLFASMGKKRDTVGRLDANPEQWVLGVGLPLYMAMRPGFEAYISPALAIIHQKDIPGANFTTNPDDKSSDTTFGPALKIGALYMITPNWTVGVEFQTLTNWFSDKMPASMLTSNAFLGLRF